MTASAFTEANRAKPMWETVAYRDVPMFRCLAMALDHAADHGRTFQIFSADRRDSVLATFNAQHGTNLHGQQYLYENQGKPGFFPANPPNRTSHCLFSDGNPVYQTSAGEPIPAGGALPDYMLGIDLSDDGHPNDCTLTMNTLHSLGYHCVRPYPGGSEAHHLVFTASPAGVLLHWNRIAAKRGD
jgi:hypothetical protein